ncbi:MAG: response regulator [Planctomycetia bacterium]|nr:response regulator [Planctomycetia bacterium]
MTEAPARFAPPKAYAVALLLSAIVIAIRFAADPWLGVKSPLLAFQLAIFLAGIYGGFGPAITATFLCSLTGWYFFLEPTYSFRIAASEDVMRLLIFAASGVVIGYCCGRMLSDRRRADVVERALSDKIVELRKSQATLAIQARLMESMAEGVSLASEDGYLVHTNAAHDAMFGYDRGELIGKHISILNDYPPQENLKRVAGVIEVLRSEGTWSGEFHNRRKDGSGFFTFARISTLKADGTTHWLCIQEDITQRKADEASLQDLNLDLRRKVAELETLLEVLPIGIGIAEDRDCRVIRANPSLAEMLKMPTGKNASLTAPAEERPTTFKVLQRGVEIPSDELPMQLAASAGRSVRDVEIDVVFADGRITRLLESASPLFDEQGSPRGSVGAFVDITDRIVAHEERQKLIVQLTQRSSELAVLSQATQDVNQVLNAESILRTLVAAALQMTGAEGGMAGLVENDVVRFSDYHRRGERIAIDLEFRSNDPRGVPTWIMLHRKPYLSEDAFADDVIRSDVRAAYGVHGFVAVPIFGRDDRLLGCLELHNKPAPEQFTQHDIEKLQGLAAGAAIALENAGLLQQVRDADRRKDEFLAMLAHELRNPLAPVRSALDVIRLDERPDDPSQALFEIMDRQVSHMGRLIDDLLDVSRITRGRIELQRKELDLTALVNAVVVDHRQVTTNAGLTLVANVAAEPLWISGDETRLAQVLDNLFSNSVKFTDRGGKIEITLAASPDDGEAELSIRDTGIGIGAEDLPRIFNAFAQADRSLDRRRGGLGLGLAISKGIIELHGGSVQAASTGLGKGSTITLQLPLIQKQAVAMPTPASPQSASHASLRVLIVEDNRDAADTLRLLLKAHGYAVSVAYSGPEGVEAAALSRPEVVLCDIGLPGMDGYAVASALRASPDNAHLRLIALSGYGREEDRRRALQAGFDDHMTKPADVSKLLVKLLAYGSPAPESAEPVGN